MNSRTEAQEEVSRKAGIFRQYVGLTAMLESLSNCNLLPEEARNDLFGASRKLQTREEMLRDHFGFKHKGE